MTEPIAPQWTIRGPSDRLIEKGPVTHTGGDYAIISNGQIIAEVFHQTDKAVFQPAGDHARLITAAPKLLGACIKAIADLEAWADTRIIRKELAAAIAEATTP